MACCRQGPDGGCCGESWCRPPMEDDEGRSCRVCDAPLDDDGTEEEERAADAGLCVDCYE
jgi:hypothetical protein